MARTSSLEVVAGSKLLGTSRRSRRSLSRRQSSGMKESATSTSLSHGRRPTRMVGGLTSSGRDRWSFGLMPALPRPQAPVEDASRLQRRNNAVARTIAEEVILREWDDSKQLSRDEQGEQEALVHVRTRTREQTAGHITLSDGIVTSTRSSCATRPTRRRSRLERRPGSGTSYNSRSTTTRT